MINELYSDPHDVNNFRKWLRIIISEEFDINIGEEYKQSAISREIGLFTFRYLKLYTKEGRSSIPRLKSFEEAIQVDNNTNMVHVFIRSESIHDDIIKCASQLNVNLDSLNLFSQTRDRKTNTSIRTSDYRWYYNDDSISLVANKDKLIINKHDYSF